ncbi:MAG TPA: IS630 family transposase [Steroidobacteraceae bacterium]|nr:IS630 family transposase [Steroidobacteraceae bacterium]
MKRPRLLLKKGLRDALAAACAAHPGKRIELWFMDEARVGQKGSTGHRWWLRGERPRGLCDQRYDSAYIFGAVRPATGDDFALVLPAVSIQAMQLFLDQFAARLAADTHAGLVLDGAGWHGSPKLLVPDNVTLLPLPPYAPELNLIERVWLYLRERSLSHRVFAGYHAIVDACSTAWNSLSPERLRSLTAFPWLPQISS